ncbi:MULTISPECIES: acetyl-CoA carboxylase biotin carboxyl carrier protein [Exiguobacterium]|uniref:Biotin carboxyl carrier protein of acetyl-CoA carboxylase n=1 Tax=Exiguobacterium aurantiacum TaxID=33987 RepID=A0A377FU83_9BACL|nr:MULTISPECIES: acetyl-CoA carboxylase biotin carboxyl carrier protein [Exiguobacterium]STO07883.1 Biotin carboxyl carrier protein of acetyl-CoA carboxylase [Exiguobacterium aurantiacum]
MQIDHIKELMELLDQTSIHEMELETSEFKLSLKKEAAPQIVTQAAQAVPVTPVAAPVVTNDVEEVAEPVAAPAYKTITSPMVGTFYSRPAPDKEAFVKVGDRVEAGQVVCILEAMKLFNDVETEIGGEIVEMLVADGDLVEYGQALFSVK